MTAIPELRPATPADQTQIISLIGRVLSEYGETICLDDGGAEADLLSLRESFFDLGGCFWVLLSPGLNAPQLSIPAIIGTHAAVPDRTSPEVCVFKRLYLDQAHRGTECGTRLMQVAIDWATANDFHRIEFWSDTRFERAHRFFEKFGFQRTGKKRTMEDSHTPYQEFHFEKLITR